MPAATRPTRIRPATTIAYDSPIGRLHLAATDRGLVRCHVRPGSRPAADGSVGARRWLRRTVAWLDDYFAGARVRFDIPVDWAATGLSSRDVGVLDGLAARVDHGQTISYGALAALVGATPDGDHPSPAQRVGAALAANPVLVVVPCHRVVAASGHLTGYAAGLRAKRRLLDLETTHFAPVRTFDDARTSA